MARMIPSEYYDYSSSKAEEFLFMKLKTALDDSWTIFHSYNLLCAKQKENLADAEIDFLVFHPVMGLLALEVKGGSIRYQAGKWYQNNIEQKDFLKQAIKNKFAIVEYLLKKICSNEPEADIGRLPFIAAHALCFPDTFTALQNLPGGCENVIIYGFQMSHLRESIESILKQAGKRNALDKKQEHHVLSYLCTESSSGTGIFDRMKQEERVFFALTGEQMNLLEHLADYKRALISGCAGSGKTLIAIKKAKMLANDGLSTLFLCYNNLLCSFIKNELKDISNLTVSTYHDFCIDNLNKQNILVEGDASQNDFWNVLIPEKFADNAEALKHSFDAIIVDEGQDFREFYWLSMEDLVKPGGHFYIFYDEAQNIYNEELKLPQLSIPFKLKKNCRNTRAVFEKIQPLAPAALVLHEKAPDGLPVREYQADTPKLRLNHLSRVLHELVEKESVPEEDIVILGAHSFENTCLSEENKVGKFTISRDGTTGKHIIRYYTYMKFKGCESPVVILLDVCDEDRWNNKGLYTAMSRARHLLIIIKK